MTIFRSRTLTNGSKTYLLTSQRGLHKVSAHYQHCDNKSEKGYGSQITRADVPGRIAAIWQVKDNYLQLEAFPDASLMMGLLDKCFVALIMIQCGRGLGDSVVEGENSANRYG